MRGRGGIVVRGRGRNSCEGKGGRNSCEGKE